MDFNLSQLPVYRFFFSKLLSQGIDTDLCEIINLNQITHQVSDLSTTEHKLFYIERITLVVSTMSINKL